MSNTVASNSLTLAYPPTREHAQWLHQTCLLWTENCLPVFISLCSHCALQCILSLQLWNLLLHRCIHQHKYILAFPFLPVFLHPGFHEFCWRALGLPHVSPQSCPVRTVYSSCSKQEDELSEQATCVGELPGVRLPSMGPGSIATCMLLWMKHRNQTPGGLLSQPPAAGLCLQWLCSTPYPCCSPSSDMAQEAINLFTPCWPQPLRLLVGQ